MSEKLHPAAVRAAEKWDEALRKEQYVPFDHSKHVLAVWIHAAIEDHLKNTKPTAGSELWFKELLKNRGWEELREAAQAYSALFGDGRKGQIAHRLINALRRVRGSDE